MTRRYRVGVCALCKGTLYLVSKSTGISLRWCPCSAATLGAVLLLALAACVHATSHPAPSPMPGMAPDKLRAVVVR